MDGWVKIYSSDSPLQIEIAKSVLHENNIDAMEVSKRDSVYIFGEIELYVKDDNAIISKIILTQNNLWAISGNVQLPVLHLSV